MLSVRHKGRSARHTSSRLFSSNGHQSECRAISVRHSFSCAFLDAVVDANGVACCELRNLSLQLLFFQLFDDFEIHNDLLSTPDVLAFHRSRTGFPSSIYSYPGKPFSYLLPCFCRFPLHAEKCTKDLCGHKYAGRQRTVLSEQNTRLSRLTKNNVNKLPHILELRKSYFAQNW